jgi:hypothetical protein
MTTVALFLQLALAANPYLGEGKALFEALKYPEAEARLRTAAQVPETTVDERRAIYDLLARAVLAQGRGPDAELVYAELLAKDAGAPAPKGAPKVRDAFQRAKERLYPQPFARIVQLPAAPGKIEVSLLDPWSVIDAVVLIVGQDEQKLSPTGQGRYSAELAGGAQFRVEARSKDALVLATLGSSDAPLAMPSAPKLLAPASTQTPEVIAPEDLGPSKWPAYAVGGATVVALAAGTVLAISAAADSRAAGESGEALELRALDAQARDKAIGANVAFGLALVGVASTAYLVWKW